METSHEKPGFYHQSSETSHKILVRLKKTSETGHEKLIMGHVPRSSLRFVLWQQNKTFVLNPLGHFVDEKKTGLTVPILPNPKKLLFQKLV